MPQASANVNVMIKAARKAARSLLRDFGEVENLQVSSKSPGDFVSRADIRAEQLVREELTDARPNYGWLGEESAEAIIASKNGSPTEIIAESADLLYHLFVLLAYHDIPFAAVEAALRERHHGAP